MCGTRAVPRGRPSLFVRRLAGRRSQAYAPLAQAERPEPRAETIMRTLILAGMLAALPVVAHAATASPISFGVQVNGSWSTAKPVQWWKARLEAGRTYAVAGGSGWCSEFSVYAPN